MFCKAFERLFHLTSNAVPTLFSLASISASMPSRRHEQPGRDQDPSPFTPILQRLLELDHCANAAVLVDAQGEAVDYAGILPIFYTKISGAYFRIALDDITEHFPKQLGMPQQIIVRAGKRSFVVRR